MKIIKYFFTLMFVSVLLPVFTNALDKNYCDNVVYREYYDKFGDKENRKEELKFGMGDRNNRGKYIGDALRYCANPNIKDKCDWARFGSDRFGYNRALVNMPTYALLLNNIPLFEALITEGGYAYLLDNGVYMVKEKEFNEEFLTQAFQAVKEGQVGILEYLIKKYDPNLLKLSGYIYRSPYQPHNPVDVKTLAQNALNRYQKNGDYARVECMVAVQKVIDDWYAKHEHEKKYIEDAKRYNEIVEKWAPENIMENITPFEFTPSIDIFKLQSIENNFTQSIENIDTQIDILMKEIMHDFDFSAFGNQI